MTPHPSPLAEEAALRAAFAQAHVRAQRTEAQQRMVAALIINIIRLLELWYAAWLKTRDTEEATANPAAPNQGTPTQSNCVHFAPHLLRLVPPATTGPDSVHAQSPPPSPPRAALPPPSPRGRSAAPQASLTKRQRGRETRLSLPLCEDALLAAPFPPTTASAALGALAFPSWRLCVESFGLGTPDWCLGSYGNFFPSPQRRPFSRP